MTVNVLCKQCNLDTFCVLRQSFCGNFKLSAEFYDRKYRLLECMDPPSQRPCVFTRPTCLTLCIYPTQPFLCQSTPAWPRLRAACASSIRKSGLNICSFGTRPTIIIMPCTFKGCMHLARFRKIATNNSGFNPHVLRLAHRSTDTIVHTRKRWSCIVGRFIWIDI